MCFASYGQDAQHGILKIRLLTIQCLKAIRHDEILKMHFKRAHELTLEIKKESKEIKNANTNK